MMFMISLGLFFPCVAAPLLRINSHAGSEFEAGGAPVRGRNVVRASDRGEHRAVGTNCMKCDFVNLSFLLMEAAEITSRGHLQGYKY